MTIVAALKVVKFAPKSVAKSALTEQGFDEDEEEALMLLL